MDHEDPHRAVLRKPFTAQFRTSGFSATEVETLARHGAWMQALAEGSLLLFTTAQSHFLRVAQGIATPETVHEKLWLKFVSASRPPSEPSPNGDARPKPVEEALPEMPNAARILELARADGLTSLQLLQVVDRSSEFGLTDEQISELRYRLQLRVGTSSNNWSMCHFCQGDGGPGGRCHHCGGNGFEP